MAVTPRVQQILSILERLRPSSIVDLGAGGGQLLAEIEARRPGVSLAGVDIAAAQLAENARRLPRISWHQLDLDAAAEIPGERRGRFGAVIACEIIEHLENQAIASSVRENLVSDRDHGGFAH